MKFLGTLLFAIFALNVFLNRSTYFEIIQVKNIDPPKINLDQVADGIYQGKYMYQKQTVEVSVKVENHKITDIQVIKNLKDNIFKIYTRAAQSTIPQVIQSQSVAVPTDRQQTPLLQADQKAILLAVCNALGETIPAKSEASKYNDPIFIFLTTILAMSFCAGGFSIIAQVNRLLASGPSQLSIYADSDLVKAHTEAEWKDFFVFYERKKKKWLIAGDIAVGIMFGSLILAWTLFLFR